MTSTIMARDTGHRDIGATLTEACATLFVGPCYGEFGHEIMFAAIARYYARQFKETIVCTRQPRQALYADFASSFSPHDIECEGMCAGSTAATAPLGITVEWFIPRDVERLPQSLYTGRQNAAWHKYGIPDDRWRGALVLHARNRKHVPARNWAQKNWHKLARQTLREGLVSRVVCIGTREDSVGIEGAVDLRGASLQEQMNALASARLILGPSSGPMHLASLCGCPHVVWCGGGASERKETTGRYRSGWNPFKTRAFVHECSSWQPGFGVAWSWLLEGLEGTT